MLTENFELSRKQSGSGCKCDSCMLQVAKLFLERFGSTSLFLVASGRKTDFCILQVDELIIEHFGSPV